MITWSSQEHAALARHTCRWLFFGTVVGGLVGLACALFLRSLDAATQLRFNHPWLLLLLPVAGLAIALLYKATCKKSEQGNNLIIEEIHEPGGGVPARMAPLVLAGTLISHVTGASVGREGTAVQMGGSIAGALGRMLRFMLRAEEGPTLLMAGVAAGFGGVFGTPIAGAVFAAEVLTRGSLKYRALGPCLIAAFTADIVCRGWGGRHTDYRALVGDLPPGTPHLLLQVLIATLCFGLVAAAFVELAHGVKAAFARTVKKDWLRPAIGGVLVIALAYAAAWMGGTLHGTDSWGEWLARPLSCDFLGLGVDSSDPHATTLTSCFFIGGALAGAWLWKMAFTAVSVGSGLKGGEVTPLFFIGAALGNALPEAIARGEEIVAKGYWGLTTDIPERQLDTIRFHRAPAEFFAALGMIAVFAGAANTPLACTIMAMELFGPQYAPWFAIACFGAYMVSGKNGIYTAQKK